MKKEDQKKKITPAQRLCLAKGNAWVGGKCVEKPKAKKKDEEKDSGTDKWPQIHIQF